MSKQRFWIKYRRILLIAAVVVVAAGGLLLYLHDRSSKRTAAKSTATTPMGPETPQVDQSGSSGGKADSTSSGAANTQNQPATDQSQVNDTLTAPSGQLAGAQKPPDGSGSTAAVTQGSPNVSASCLTLAGATCTVQLSGPNGESKTINASTNDGQGNFTFSWSAQGYANGTWQVKLVATKDGQTGSANIGPLTVSQ